MPSHPPTPPDPDRAARLATLFHRRWAVPVLAELCRGRGAKLVTLTSRLEASPGSVRLALDHLIEAGWVAPNPGYGHPMRPEYILTPAGEPIAHPCRDLDDALLRLDARDLGLRKWSMPTLDALRPGPVRFTDIRAGLPGITDRALSLALGDLLDGELAQRRDIDGPIGYIPARRARRVCGILAEL
jgi:DNA-binding HxlR family transcriptional regulator